MNGTNLSWPITILIGLATVILLGGTMALLLDGKPVPEFLVGFDGSIIPALVGLVGFLELGKAHASATGALADAHDTSVRHLTGIADREHQIATQAIAALSTSAPAGNPAST